MISDFPGRAGGLLHLQRASRTWAGSRFQPRAEGGRPADQLCRRPVPAAGYSHNSTSQLTPSSAISDHQCTQVGVTCYVTTLAYAKNIVLPKIGKCKFCWPSSQFYHSTILIVIRIDSQNLSLYKYIVYSKRLIIFLHKKPHI